VEVSVVHRLTPVLSTALLGPSHVLGRFFTVHPAGVAHGDEGVPGYAEEEDEASSGRATCAI